MNSLDAEIAATQKRLADLIAKRDTPSEDQQWLATKLHKALCRHNHTDGCSWMYEDDGPLTWSHYAHAEYLKQARDIYARAAKEGHDEAIVQEIVLAIWP